MSRKSLWCLSGAVCAGLLIAMLYTWHRSGPEHDADVDDGIRLNGREREEGLTSARFDSFVGDAVCAECHSEIASSYARSGMALTWRPIPEEPPSYFLEDSVVPDGDGVYQYRTLVDESGRPMQQETLVEAGPEPAHMLTRTARYLVGSGNHAQTLVAEDNGYLHQMPLAWFADADRWDLNPGYEQYNHRFSRPIAPGCIACHGSYAEHRAHTHNRYAQPVPSGIGCERCHGPGEAHVQLRSSHAEIEPGEIVDPGDLSAEAGNDVCLQCHLQGDVSLFPPGRDEFSFQPGDRLRDHRMDFLVQTEGESTFGVASHGARLLQSRCYQESSDLTCFTCHDPHRPISDFTPSDFDANCIACHQPESCSRPTPREELTDSCVQCHMARRPTREGIHLVVTDHWIRRRPVEVASPSPLEPDDNVELVSCWPDFDADDVTLGSAYVLLHETMGPQHVALNHGVGLLGNAEMNERLNADGKYWLASGLVSQRRSREAIRVFREVLQSDPGHLEARFRLGVAHSQLGEHAAAAIEYERVRDAAPDWLDPFPLLSRIYLHQGRHTDAIRLLEEQHDYRSTPESLADLALARSLDGDATGDCLSLTDEALQLDPRNVRVHLVRGHLFTVASDRASAAQSYRLVLELEPGNPVAIQALQSLRAL